MGMEERVGREGGEEEEGSKGKGGKERQEGREGLGVEDLKLHLKLHP